MKLLITVLEEYAQERLCPQAQLWTPSLRRILIRYDLYKDAEL